MTLALNNTFVVVNNKRIGLSGVESVSSYVFARVRLLDNDGGTPARVWRDISRYELQIIVRYSIDICSEAWKNHRAYAHHHSLSAS